MTRQFGGSLADADAPGAILQQNLYGVDIDLRAVQLAAWGRRSSPDSSSPARPRTLARTRPGRCFLVGKV
jgi:hypothetical protein